MTDAAITTDGLTRSFRKLRAVDGVHLRVPSGCVFGLAGRNGAGKTTLIRMLLGLLQPTAGSAQVLGLDPRKQDVPLRQRVGYVPEAHHIYPWMRVREVLRFCAPFYPTWDAGHADALIERFGLDPQRRIRELSRGMVAKVALTLALAPRPPLLVLDEPTSGLDAVVRREFLESIVGLIADEGATVLISSHLLADVERVVERVAFLDAGKLTLVEDLAGLKARFRRVDVALRNRASGALEISGLRRVTRHDRSLELIFDGFDADSLAAVRDRCPNTHITEHGLSLEDIFIELFGTAAGNGD